VSVDHQPGEARFLEARILVPFLLTAVIWGSTWLVIKGQLGDVPPSWSVTWRFAGAAIGMFAFALAQRQPLVPDARGLKVAAVMGCSVFSCNFQFVYRSEQYLTSGLVAVLFALLLVPNTILARIFLGQRITRGFLLGTAIALIGIGLLMLHEYRLALAQNAAMGANVLIGGVMVLTALIFASIGNVVQASPAARGQPVPTLLAWAMLIGAMVDGAIAWYLSGPPRFDLTPSYAGGVAYLAIIGSVVTFPMYNGLLRALGPGRAAYNGVLVPVVAMLLSTLFEGYRWSLLAGAGAGLAILGLVVALRARSPSR